jgi:hypothetical protein
MLRPYAAGEIDAYPASTLVNDLHHGEAKLIERSGGYGVNQPATCADIQLTETWCEGEGGRYNDELISVLHEGVWLKMIRTKIKTRLMSKYASA